jgi:hypothetical protein
MWNAQDWQISDVRQQGDSKATANADPCHSPRFAIAFLPSNEFFRCRLIVIGQMLFVGKYLS